MFISGFTFVRNAIRYDYPVVESIRSVIPLTDEFVVAVGNSEDGTRELVESIGDPKIRIVDTVWDDSLREGGRVLAVETDKALAALSPAATWAFYIQADEVVHENGLDNIRAAMLKYAGDRRVEGLLFNYLHFYGSYDFIGDSRAWYRKEVRVIRPKSGVRSFRDAQGFRVEGRKLSVVPVDATIHHYGWVKPPALQQAKQENFHRYWHNDNWMQRAIPKAAEFDYSGIDSLARFTGSHPAEMINRIASRNWTFDFDPSRRRMSSLNRFLAAVEHCTGWRPGEYRNYRLLEI